MAAEAQQSVTKLPAPAARLLQSVASLYGRGDLDGAEKACRQLLLLRPDQPDALHVLGLVAWQRGERERAVEEVRRASASDPRKPQPYNSLGVMLRDLGDVAAAEAAFRTAIDLLPNYPEALTNLGNVLSEAGRFADAEAAHRRAIELAPRYADARNNLATVFSKQGRWDEAAAECRTAVDLQPGRADFHLYLGNALAAIDRRDEAVMAYRRAAELAPDNADAHANLGLALYQIGRPDQALAPLRAAAALRPDQASIWCNLAAAQIDLDDLDAALISARRALALDPDSPEANNCVGQALAAKQRPDEAMAAYETAIRLRPDHHKTYNNLGLLFHEQGRFPEALTAYARAVELVPDYAEAHWNKGMLHLLLGDLEQGWRGYERGLEMKRGRGRYDSGRSGRWRGEPLAGKTIMVSAEQGIGDQIMFAALLPDLVRRGAACRVLLDDRLYPLLRRSIDGLTLIPGDQMEPGQIGQQAADFEAPIGSLCRWLRPDLASFFPHAGYLKADPSRVAALRARYRGQLGDRPLVGISWRGGVKQVGRSRSIPLTAWSPILGRRDVGFVSLQYGDCSAELASARAALGVEILHDRTVDPLKDLESFAAQTAAMDLVISIDNSTVHMAGALNVPAWALLPFVPDWRWMLGRSDSPWYPCVRLFRQPAAGNWPPVIDSVARQLEGRFGAPTPANGSG